MFYFCIELIVSIAQEIMLWYICYTGGDGFSRGRSEGGSSHRGFGGQSDWQGDSLEIEVASKDVSRIIGLFCIHKRERYICYR